MKKTILAIGAAGTALAVITACGPVTQHAKQVGNSSTSLPADPATTAPAPPPAPNPDGTFEGSCDYTLSDSLYGTDYLVGEVDLANTGNIGTVVKVKISWPQLGYSPITATKTVRTHPGQHKPVRFHLPAEGNTIDLLQSWQENHDFKDGCHYRATMVSTFGSPSGG